MPSAMDAAYTYCPRKPEDTSLYRVVREHWQDFLDIWNQDPDHEIEVERRSSELGRQILADNAPHIWQDLSTGNTWRFQAAKVSDGRQAERVCANAEEEKSKLWRIPAEGEVDKALSRGLCDPRVNESFHEARAAGAQVYVASAERGYRVLDLKAGRIVDDDGSRAPARSLLCVW